eukprot:TRINITY_DN7187_c0_g1_i2.p1 TRINITY_DN7187_c0_g1~~TRINITY_DN7187_c0_g1_i2.p1  ORF type:complete len:141 (+),score=8.94 TRINITY_DN7187_c0_g1_i2:152-574(+)
MQQHSQRQDQSCTDRRASNPHSNNNFHTATHNPGIVWQSLSYSGGWTSLPQHQVGHQRCAMMRNRGYAYSFWHVSFPTQEHGNTAVRNVTSDARDTHGREPSAVSTSAKPPGKIHEHTFAGTPSNKNTYGAAAGNFRPIR